MKLILSALFAAAALSTAMVGSAAAYPAFETVCTTTTTSPNPPSGTYVAPDGHKWAGFNADGTPPNSLVSSGGSSTTCTEVPTT